LHPTTHSVDGDDPDKTQPCKSGKKPKTQTSDPENIITETKAGRPTLKRNIKEAIP
jgi:hypothetical protein